MFFLHYRNYIGIKKIQNAVKVYLSFLFSVFTTRKLFYYYPVSISVELTNHCNLRCAECVTGTNMLTRLKGYMPDLLFTKIVTEIKKYTIYLNLYFQGESFLHPQIFNFIKIARTNGLITCISTNGHFLNTQNCLKILDSGLSKIIISLDGATPATYNAYRKNGDFDTVMQGIRNLISLKKQKQSVFPVIVIQCLVTKKNEHELNTLKTIFKNEPVKILFKTLHILNLNRAAEILPGNKKYNRYFVNNLGNVILKKRYLQRCFRVFYTSVITWNGFVLPCCFDKNAGYVLGNINENQLKDILKSQNYRDFLRNVLNNRKSIAICNNCVPY